MKKVPATELSARSRFSQRTFAGAHGDGRDARGDMRRLQTFPPSSRNGAIGRVARRSLTSGRSQIRT